MHDREEIGHHIEDYFKNLFAATPSHFSQHLDGLIPSVISTEDNARPCRVPNDLEIWDAVKALGGTKAPGPDRFTALFFQRYWQHVRREVISMVKHFFISDFLLKQLSHSFIALIPKADAPARISQFRPISLCNVCYKVISKILTLCLSLLCTS